jgi:3-deoxy-D-manno-octulosonic-acid transferase
MPRFLFFAYSLLWHLALPFLLLSPRLRCGFRTRLGISLPGSPCDLWIQAASGGEARLALEILKRLRPDAPLSVMVTSCTKQGLEILNGRKDLPLDDNLTVFTSYFPFDLPWVLTRFFDAVRPGTLVLLETELWPNLLHTARKRNCPVLVVNGRMTSRSLARYLGLGKFFTALAPDEILAIAGKDADRFAVLWGPDRVTEMQNIKFDRIDDQEVISYVHNPLSSLFKPRTPLVVLGSIREEEEQAVRETLLALQKECPRTVTALFPRHMHRLEGWTKWLEKNGLTWSLRSQLNGPSPFGSVILWDRFGELVPAYAMARSVFVGGSMAPLGGQNFLEPLAQGVIPVIGPFWSNFQWVGEEIFEAKLVTRVHTVQELVAAIKAPMKPRARTQARVRKFFKEKQGGTDMACRVIERIVKGELIVKHQL